LSNIRFKAPKLLCGKIIQHEMKLKFLLFTLLTALTGLAQEKATVNGTIADKDMDGAGLAFASVTVKGTTISTNTDDSGAYTLTVDAGTITLVFDFIGYESKEQVITIAAGETQTVNIEMGSSSVELDQVVIQAAVNREKESALLFEQRNSATITQSIGAQELSRKGVSDAAGAVTKVTGISKTEGNSGIFVRGLGDRYNSTTLNGLPIPSNEPENKNVALDLFSTDIIQTVGISKTYTTDLYGDVGGANVNIVSKEHTGSPKFVVEIGTGINNKAFGSDFKIADGAKKTGFYNINTPTSISEYQFRTNWSPESQSNPVNANFGLYGGRDWNIGEEGRLKVFATLNYGNGYTYRNGFQRIVSNENTNIVTDFYSVDKFEFSTKSTGLANLAYEINNNNTLKLNSVFVNASKTTFGEYDTFVGQGDDRFEYNSQTLTEQNKLFINQLLGEHILNEKLDLDWGASYSTVNADQPDRITNNLIQTGNGGYIFNTGAPTANNRYFQYIDENEIAAKALFNYKLFKGQDSLYKGKLTFGYNGRIKTRDFEATQFNFRVSGAENIPVNPNNIDSFLNASNQSTTQNVPGTFFISTSRLLSLTPFTYNGDLNVHAAVANLEHQSSEKLTYTVGIRAEKILQELEWVTNFPIAGASFDDATIDKVYILPSASLKYSLTENQNLRAAASKTYTLPQFKEKAPFRYEGVGENSIGNPFLQPSDNYNLDIKWEIFPKNDEVISAGIFGKYIDNPISQVLLNSALNDNTYVNAGNYAYVAGAEFEIKKNIWEVDQENIKQALSFGLNATVMYSQQELDSEKVATETNNSLSVNFNEDSDRLQGASPLLVNADITYRKDSGNFRPIISLVGNYFHDRIYSLGSFERGNIVEKGIVMLNFVSSASIGEKWNVGFAVENMLNYKIRRVQQNRMGDIDTYNYRAGIDFSLSLKYNIF
jgi:TonB-dependent receptor